MGLGASGKLFDGLYGPSSFSPSQDQVVRVAEEDPELILRVTMLDKLHTQSADQGTVPKRQPRILEQVIFENDTHVNFRLAWEFTRVHFRLLTGDEGNSQICKDLFLWGRQEITDDESQGLDRQFLGGIELNGTGGSDDLKKISDHRFRPLNGLYDTSSASSGSKG